jgi:hypothetical protein
MPEAMRADRLAGDQGDQTRSGAGVGTRRQGVEFELRWDDGKHGSQEWIW